MSEQADARAKELASEDGRSLTEIVGGYGTDLLSSISITFAKVTEMPDHIAAAAAQFSQGRKGAPISLFIIAFVGSVIAGFVGAFALRRASGKLEESIVAVMPQSLWHKFRLLVLRFFFQLSRLIAFFLIALWSSKAEAQQAMLLT